MARAIRLLPGEEEALQTALGPSWRTARGKDPARLTERVGEIAAALDQLVAGAEAAAARLGTPQPRTRAQIDSVYGLTARILALDPFPADCLAVSVVDELERGLGEAHALFDQLRRGEERLWERFADGLVELVDEEMLVRYRTDHQGFWARLFGGAYRRDQRALRGQLKTPRNLSLGEAHDAVALALELRQQRERWRETRAPLREALGARFRERETEWERVRSDLAELRGILADWRGDAGALRELLDVEADGEGRRALEPASSHLGLALARYCRAAEAIGQDSLADPEAEVAGVAAIARGALDPLRRINEGTAALYTALAAPPDDFKALARLIADGVWLMEMTQEDERLAPALTENFGRFFQHEETDWRAVADALDWTANFLEALEAVKGQIDGALQGHATDPQPNSEYQERAKALDAAISVFVEDLAVLDERFDVAATGWRSWDAAAFADLEGWSADLREHAGGAPSWAEYQEAVREFDERLGAGSSEALRKLTERAEDAPGIVRRRIYSAWLEDVYKAEPGMRDFNAVDHEAVRARFRELDELFPIAARQRVRERAFEKYPDRSAALGHAGQLGMLHGELSKKRRQLPVRRLIAGMPNLTQALKPCFLMSPLAISQYLPLAGDGLEFDVVIFDEASQVLPEEAIPAIDRAKQAIVVGDPKQLPPTSFFRRNPTDDDDTDDDSDADDDQASGDSLQDRESILDVMVGKTGAGIAERYLGVHYRSRHESLIRFSNYTFYSNRLLTFSGPDPKPAGIRDVYLPDATYDAGGSRTNRDEAERVADIVFELMEALPGDESIGVVALSRAQADLIEHLIDQRGLLRRDLEHRFREDGAERFFVKNLENVQGDERDHMILSVGYGPTPARAVSNHFGPINKEGGERRLNVVVTRARRSMTVVHSLRPESITSQQSGARQLRRYLEYIRDPEGFFEAEVTGTGEPESPFEEAVLAALRARGHRVDAQVGVSGYRIDLAIKSKDGERYDLSIECDGWTYHNSPAARDRDWLRQQVLEGLGWRIHRVWSTAWTRDSGAEIARIEQALERARTHRPEPPPSPTPRIPDEPDESDEPFPTAPPSAALLFDEHRDNRMPPRPRRDPNRPVDHVAPAEIDAGLLLVARESFGIERADLIRETARQFGWRRTGRRIGDNLNAGVERLLKTGRLSRQGDMLVAVDGEQAAG